MQHAQLVSHVDTDVVSRVELRALPDPEATLCADPPTNNRANSHFYLPVLCFK